MQQAYAPLLLARIRLISLFTLMFLKIKHDDESSLIEVLDLKQLFDPFTPSVEARLHGGDELQEPQLYIKLELLFPSGELLPECWIHPHYPH